MSKPLRQRNGNDYSTIVIRTDLQKAVKKMAAIHGVSMIEIFELALLEFMAPRGECDKKDLKEKQKFLEWSTLVKK